MPVPPLQADRHRQEDETLTHEVIQASRDFRFFHWHLRFGEVMEKGGFDCVLGNPPWEVSQLNEVDLFSAVRPEIANLSGARRKQSIANLEMEDPQAWKEFANAKHSFDCRNEFYRGGASRYALKGRSTRISCSPNSF